MNFELNRIRALFKRGKQILHEEGFLSLFKRFFMYETCYLYENNLDGLNFPCRVDNLILRVITRPEEFDQLLADGFNFSSYGMGIQQFRERLGRGAILFCAFVGKELAHGSWIGMDGGTHEDFYAFPMNYGHIACIGGTMTVPKYRRKSINVYVHSEMFRHIREKGLSKAVLEVHKNNIVAQNSQAKLGSYIWGTGHHIRLLLLLNFRWLTPIEGFDHIKISTKKRGKDR